MANLDFEAINKEYSEKLFRKASMMCQGNHTFAEEAVQQTLVAAWKHQDQFDGKNIGGWLSTILRNKVIDARRPNRTASFMHNGINIDEDGAMKESYKALTVQAADPEPVNVFELVTKAIESLPKEYVGICKMRLLDEMTQKDVSKALNVPVGTIMSRMFRILPTLRTRVKVALAKAEGE
jgi:RNA polymerase sigma-70 factor (ECF subfamily)